jgi:hypothetical protein
VVDAPFAVVTAGERDQVGGLFKDICIDTMRIVPHL